NSEVTKEVNAGNVFTPAGGQIESGIVKYWKNDQQLYDFAKYVQLVQFDKNGGIDSGHTRQKIDALFMSAQRAPRHAFHTGGFVKKFHSGGPSLLSDEMAAILQHGEFVINRNAVRKYGVSTMNAINSGLVKQIPSAPKATAISNNTEPSTVIYVDTFVGQ